MTDGAGNVVMEQDYMPFGEDLPVVGQTEVLDEEAGGYKYTGQKEVVSIGLYYYGARYYDPSIGRFITEDTYPGELANPQSQNLYLYVVNNPLRYIDPTGNVPEQYDFNQELNLAPSKYDFSLLNYSFEIPNYWKEIYEGVSFREFDDFVVLKVQYEAIANNTIEIKTHINDRAYVNKKAMTVANTISTLPDKDDIIFGGTGTYFYIYGTSFSQRAFGNIINKGIEMTPEELSHHPKYYNITNHRSFVGYNEEGFVIGRGKDIFNSNLIWGLGGLTSIMEDGKYTSYSKDIVNDKRQYFTSDQLYSTRHMMFGINRNNNQELHIFMNTTNIGFTTSPDEKFQNIIKELGLTDVAKGDGGGSSQWWLNNGFSLQYEERPLGNMILIRKGQGK